MQVSEETKLLPCPFCGGEPEMIEAEEAGPNAMVICCRGCMASSKVIYALKDSVDDLLAEAWNTRATPAPAGDVGENETAPEYIWANIEEDDDQEPYIEYLSDEPWSPENPGVKYVRADIHASLTADKERLEARAAELEAALAPFADIAEWDISDAESDEDFYRPMDPRYAVGGVLRVKHFRRARATLDKGGR